MSQEVRWNELRVGLIGAAAIAVIVLVILLFARVGALHGNKATLYVVTSDATGVLKGTEVWLSGQKIGQVDNVHFRGPTADTSERLVVESEVLADKMSRIRRDSHAEIKPGSSMIGVPVIFLTAGSSRSPGLHDGDTIRTAPPVKVADMGEEMSAAASAASSLATDVKALSSRFGDQRNTVGAIRAHGIPGLSGAGTGVSALMTKVRRGNGTLGMISRGNLGARVSSAMAGVDSIRTLLASNRGNIGRFRKDSTLGPKIQGMLATVDSLRAMTSISVGSIGAAHSDSVLTKRLAKMHESLSALMKDVKSHPLRYIAF